MSEKVKSLEFEGVASHEGQCFCWDVDEATYRQIEGKRSHRLEAECREEASVSPDAPWHLEAMSRLTELGKRYRVRLEVEEMP